MPVAVLRGWTASRGKSVAGAGTRDLVFVPMVRDLLAEGVAAGEFQISDPDATAAFAVAMGTEAVRMIRDDPACRPEPALLESVRRLVGG